MGYRANQRILNRGISNDEEAPEEMFSILIHQGNASQNNPETVIRNCCLNSPVLCWAQPETAGSFKLLFQFGLVFSTALSAPCHPQSALISSIPLIYTFVSTQT